MNTSFDITIIGAGIIGLATGMKLLEKFPGLRVAIFEKEETIAAHQTGHNSGVIHSGLYYRPGALKARLCISGHDEIVRFCEEHDIRHEICGKVVIATRDEQLPVLAEFYRRGSENGVAGLKMLTAAEVKEREPYARSIAGMLVPSAGIVDFVQVAKAYAESFEKGGGALFLGAKAGRVKDFGPKTLQIQTGRGKFQSGALINCAGLYSDLCSQVLRPFPSLPHRSFQGRILPDKTRTYLPGQKPDIPCP